MQASQPRGYGQFDRGVFPVECSGQWGRRHVLILVRRDGKSHDARMPANGRHWHTVVLRDRRHVASCPPRVPDASPIDAAWEVTYCGTCMSNPNSPRTARKPTATFPLLPRFRGPDTSGGRQRLDRGRWNRDRRENFRIERGIERTTMNTTWRNLEGLLGSPGILSTAVLIAIAVARPCQAAEPQTPPRLKRAVLVD